MKYFQADLDILGVLGDLSSKTNLKEIKRCFKKKSLAMLPEKHPTVLNAHTRFEEVNAAFVRVTNSVSGSHCLKYFTILDHQLLQE